MDLELAERERSGVSATNPHQDPPATLSDRLLLLRSRVDNACRSVGRDPSSVTILGVTKRQPRAAVLAAIEAGLRDVGENYVQEARAKYAGLPPVCKHFVGHVQTNKAKAIVETFDVVQSIDRIEAGEAIAKAARGLQKAVRVLVQVNISPAERFGIRPQDAPSLAGALRALGLDVDGVMAIGPVSEDTSEIRAAFELAAATFRDVGGRTLSLGMSGDWELAVAAGSTMIRLGTSLFGPRSNA